MYNINTNCVPQGQNISENIFSSMLSLNYGLSCVCYKQHTDYILLFPLSILLKSIHVEDVLSMSSLNYLMSPAKCQLLSEHAFLSHNI